MPPSQSHIVPRDGDWLSYSWDTHKQVCGVVFLPLSASVLSLSLPLFFRHRGRERRIEVIDTCLQICLFLHTTTTRPPFFLQDVPRASLLSFALVKPDIILVTLGKIPPDGIGERGEDLEKCRSERFFSGPSRMTMTTSTLCSPFPS